MRIVGALGVALAGLSVIGAVTAYGQINTRSQYGGTNAAVVNDKGNLRVPADYRTTYPNPQKTTSTDYTRDCQPCHVPARQSDWIYTHGYPVLS
jgi:hypothetical protein